MIIWDLLGILNPRISPLHFSFNHRFNFFSFLISFWSRSFPSHIQTIFFFTRNNILITGASWYQDYNQVELSTDYSRRIAKVLCCYHQLLFYFPHAFFPFLRESLYHRTDIHRVVQSNQRRHLSYHYNLVFSTLLFFKR